MNRGRLVVVDLSKDGRLVVDRLRPPPEQTGRHARNLASEGQFRTRHYTHRQSGIIRSGKAACSGAEVTCREPIADLRRSRTYALEAKVAHLGISLVGSPSAPRDISAFAVLPHHTKSYESKAARDG